MSFLDSWSETSARRLRWALIAGWCALILSLFFPGVVLPPELGPSCAPELRNCMLHSQPGNRMFWGVVVPSGLLLITLSHEIWRRICPLAFVSQLFRSLGMQRTVLSRNGKPEVVKVKADSWLAKHHLQVQWTLLISGLCLRLLVVNSSPIGLALLLLVTLAGALAVGWAYGGKAWCQYVCPMAPVQMIVTGQRGGFGKPAHVGTTSKITQSMCRTVSSTGREQSACVACQAPCIDIDAERQYWKQLSGKRGLSWAWYSYPGLILMFFELMMLGDPLDSGFSKHVEYLRDGNWAFDAQLSQRVLLPFAAWLPLPNLIAIPLLMISSAFLSVWLFETLEARLKLWHQYVGRADSAVRAVNQTRLLATFLAINIFFWFAAPLQGLLGSQGDRLLRLLVVAVTAVVLSRSWKRTEEAYRRESTSESLRKQLKGRDDLTQALDGRSLDELLPEEVFTLAKALPAIGRSQACLVYQGVMEDMLRVGRLDCASSLLQLSELRDVLGLKEQDHHDALQVLSVEDSNLIGLDSKDLQQLNLRQEAAREQLQDLMEIANLDALNINQLSTGMRQKLDHLQSHSGLEGDDWESLLSEFSPGSASVEKSLSSSLERRNNEAALLMLLNDAAQENSLLHPLVMVMRRRLKALDVVLLRGLPNLDLSLPAPSGSVQNALDLLWLDPDPDVAGWVVMVERNMSPNSPVRADFSGRDGLQTSPFLESQCRVQDTEYTKILALLTSSLLFEDLLPDRLLWLAEHVELRSWAADAIVMEKGDPSDEILIVLEGAGCIELGDSQVVRIDSGATIGEIEVILSRPRSETVIAASEGLQAIVIPAVFFEKLLSMSSDFSRDLLSLLANRVQGTELLTGSNEPNFLNKDWNY